MTERILCAAIWLDDGHPHAHQPTKTGLVYGGHNHAAIIQQLPYCYDRRRAKQGFLTSANRYVDRAEAYVIAMAAGQIPSNAGEPCDLYSEDLYR